MQEGTATTAVSNEKAAAPNERNARAVAPSRPSVVIGRKYTDFAGAKEIVERVSSEFPTQKDPINFARIYAALGDIQTAYEYLEQAYKQRSVDLYGLTIDPRLKRVRFDPRFDGLVQRVHFATASLNPEHSKVLSSHTA